MILITVLLLLSSSSILTAEESNLSLALGAGIQNSYAKIETKLDVAITETWHVSMALNGFFSFSDRVYNNVRYYPMAAAIEIGAARFGNVSPRGAFRPFYGFAIPVGTVFITSPPRYWDNIIAGFRFFYGMDFQLANGHVLYLEASLGGIFHFVFTPSGTPDPYSTYIDSFSGFGIVAGYKF